MLEALLFPLRRFFTPLNIFQYITFRAAYAAVTALLICFLLGPWLIRTLRNRDAGERIRSVGPETHGVKSGTPTMGGLLIIAATLISVFLWMSWDHVNTWIALVSLLGFGALGFADDYRKVFLRDKKGISPRMKIIGQVSIGTAVAVLLVLTGGDEQTVLYFPLFKDPVLDLSVFYVPFAVVLLVGTSNAVNLTDGLDGLATGLVIMVGLTFAALSYVAGRVDWSAYLQIPYIPGGGELAVLCLAVTGAAVGFLWYNAHPAEIMMGDTGSLALGGIIGTIALMIKKELLLVVAGGVFVIEAASVIIQVWNYRRTGKRVFLMAPLHHHFELKGWPESKVVMRFWILGGLFAILALSTLKVR